MKIKNPFHAGEILIQKKAGEEDIALLNGRLYEDVLMMPAHKFLAQLSYIAFSSYSNGIVSTTMVYGKPGFAYADETGKNIFISRESLNNFSLDPVLKNLKVEDEVACLAIDLKTRKRIKVNGKIIEMNEQHIKIEVAESLPICPKYIQKREIEFLDSPFKNSPSIISGKDLAGDALEIVKKADTFFVGSINPDAHADVSHRGGNPGFVQVKASNHLLIPDYKGNSLFNTFGNLQLDSQCSLVFWDFDGSRFLHLWGKADVHFNGEELPINTGGTNRYWNFHIERFELQTVALPFRLNFLEMSMFNPEVVEL